MKGPGASITQARLRNKEDGEKRGRKKTVQKRSMRDDRDEPDDFEEDDENQEFNDAAAHGRINDDSADECVFQASEKEESLDEEEELRYAGIEAEEDFKPQQKVPARTNQVEP